MMTGILTLGGLGLSLSVDAFAAAIGKGAESGAGERSTRWRDALRIGVIFGFFEAITPAIGWAIGLVLSAWIAEVDHWVAFALLGGVGLHMLRQASRPAKETEADQPNKPHGLLSLAATAIATSIDATAVGVSLAFLDINIVTALSGDRRRHDGGGDHRRADRQACRCFPGPLCRSAWRGDADRDREFDSVHAPDGGLTAWPAMRRHFRFA